MTIEPGWQDEVLEFWFSELKPEDWWESKPELDEKIRARFGGLHEALSASIPPEARENARAALAAVIVFDQFPRNMYRGSGRAFGTDSLAADLVRHALASGFDADMTDTEKQFLYMPLMHSESLDDQERCINLFAALGMEDAAKFAREHRDIIERFGRFPHRNKALGRSSTPAEEEYLVGAKTYGQ